MVTVRQGVGVVNDNQETLASRSGYIRRGSRFLAVPPGWPGYVAQDDRELRTRLLDGIGTPRHSTGCGIVQRSATEGWTRANDDFGRSTAQTKVP
jgi:hypothetical protein